MRRYYLLLLLLTQAFTLAAQTEATQYFMRSLPQVSINNPAFTPVYNYSIGLPAISSVAVTYTNNGFSYNDLVRRAGGTTTADLDQWKSTLKNSNYITATGQVDLLRVGFRIHPKIYLQVSATAKAYSRAMIPGDISSLVVQANSAVPAFNTNISPKAEGSAWIESAMAAAIRVTPRLTFGARVKYLRGIMDATTIASDLSVTSPGNNSITAAADVRLRTSGVFDTSQPGYSFGSQFKNYSNNGGGADIGATYQFSEKLAFAASIVDIGKIYWRNNTYDYVLNKATANYTFSGVDADQLVQGKNSYLSAQGDSIAKRFAFQHQKTGAYSTWLPAKMYASTTYQLAKKLKAGLLVFGENFKGRFSQGISASVSKDVGRWFSTTVSYTASNTSYNNIGAGLSFNFSPFQFYVVGDNLLNAPVSLLTTQHLNNYVNNTQVFSLRAGINIIWGREKEKPQRLVSPRSKKTPAFIKARQRAY